MHQNGIIHRDLKPQNILIDNSGVVKIADLGLARNLSINLTKEKNPLTQNIVTLWYRSPELLLGETRYAEEVDSWAIGCIFAELFIRKPIFMGDSEIGQLFKILSFSGNIINSPLHKLEHFKHSFPKFQPQGFQLWPDLQNNKFFNSLEAQLLMELLQIDPNLRASPAKALFHPYFNQIFT